MSRKLLLLTSCWKSENTGLLIDGISERLNECDEEYELHIFNAYDDLETFEYFIKDREIYNLPVLENYDGMLIAFSSVVSGRSIEPVTERFAKLGKPIVSIDAHCNNGVFCGIDNYREMYQLVDHMITIHDCRTLNYVGGPEENEENQERFRAYRDCLKNHGITLDQKRIVHKSFLSGDGIEAYEEFKKYDYHMPDAVICANDNMALGYADAAAADGIIVPDYTKITGFDNILEAFRHSPSITSVNRNWKQLGMDSADTLIDCINGSSNLSPRYTKGFMCYNESCGCDKTRRVDKDYNSLLWESNQMGRMGHIQTHIRQHMLSCSNFDEFCKFLINAQMELKYGDIAVCVNSSLSDYDYKKEFINYDDVFEMYSSDGHETINRNNMMYPKKWSEKGEKIFIFSPIHISNQTLGYTVVPYRRRFLSRIKLRTLTESISIAVSSILKNQAIDAKNQP